MALGQVVTALLLALALARIQLATCHVVKGSVSCLDCDRHYDLSGIRVLVKCNQVKKLEVATTEATGSFEAKLPSDTPASSPPPISCHAKLLGGPNHLYAFKKNMFSKIVAAHDSESCTISTPLTFYASCPFSRKDSKCSSPNDMEFGSSKTIDLPLPPEWGLAPSSYYIPFFPIIGVP